MGNIEGLSEGLIIGTLTGSSGEKITNAIVGPLRIDGVEFYQPNGNPGPNINVRVDSFGRFVLPFAWDGTGREFDADTDWGPSYSFNVIVYVDGDRYVKSEHTGNLKLLVSLKRVAEGGLNLPRSTGGKAAQIARKIFEAWRGWKFTIPIAIGNPSGDLYSLIDMVDISPDDQLAQAEGGEAPAQEATAAAEAPPQEAPAQEAAVAEAPPQEAPAQEAAVAEAPAQEAPPQEAAVADAQPEASSDAPV